MNHVRVALLCLLVVCFATALQASEIPIVIDPVIKVGGLDPPAPAGIITPSFAIMSPSGNSPGTSDCELGQGTITTDVPACLFENDITSKGAAQTITSLTFNAPTVPFGSQDQCGFLTGSPFSQCGVDPLAKGGTQFTFFDGSIPFHSDFTLDFQGFLSNTSFSVTATVTPEPSSIALFLTVIGSALLGQRKWRSV